MPSDDGHRIAGEAGSRPKPNMAPGPISTECTASAHDQKPPQEAPSSNLESRCHSVLPKILGDTHQRELICKLSGDDAQLMADYLDMVSRDGDALNARERRRALALLCELAKSAQVFPRCYRLTEVEPHGQLVKCGGFADIYKGRYRGEMVCIKAFRAHEDLIRTCAPELTLWAHLQHKNILPFYGVYMLQPTPCLVSPWMGKGNVRDYLKQFPGKPRMPFISGILDGLSYLHSLHIVHGDLKAENILVSMAEQALITDFGLSSIAATSQVICGSPMGGSYRWMAPELLFGDGQAKSSCDIWSFASLYYEILADKIPFYQYDDRQILPALLVRKEIPLRPDPDVVTADWEGISDQLWDLLVMCWNYEPEARPSCTMLQGFIGTFGNQDNQSEGVTEIESCSTFRRGCSVNIDFVHVERLLNQISLSPSAAPITPSPPTEQQGVSNEAKNMSRQDSGSYLSSPQGSSRSAEGTSWLGEPLSSPPLNDKSSRNDAPGRTSGDSQTHPKKRTTLPPSFGRVKPHAGGRERENKSSKSEPLEPPGNSRSNTFTSIFSGLFRKSAPRGISVDVIKREALRPDDYVIAITGVEGNTFISKATSGWDSGVAHGLVSEIDRVSAVRITFPDGVNVVLVNTYLSDLRVLGFISDWLQDTVTLSGVLYLHHTSETLMSSTPSKHPDMFKKLCGQYWFHKVVLVTMEDVEQIGTTRQGEIQSDCWSEMTKVGSKIVGFDGTKASAWGILGPLIAQESDERSTDARKNSADLEKYTGNVAPRLQLYLRIEGQKDALKRIKEKMKDTRDPVVIRGLVAELEDLREEGESATADMRQLDSPTARRPFKKFRAKR